MSTPFPFTAGQVLTAAELNSITNLPINDQTASYILVAGDAGKRVIMNVASANTVTVNDAVFTTGDTIFIANKGAGTSTITAGSGVTINVNGSLALAQYGGGTLVALSASTFTFFPSGIKETLNVEFLLVAGGGGGGVGAGGAGGMKTGTATIPKGTSQVTVGAGGSGKTASSFLPGQNGSPSGFAGFTTMGGGLGAGYGSGGNGGSGGGKSADVGVAGVGVSGEGNDGGSNGNVSTNGGGGGGKGGVGGNGSGTTGGNGGAAATNDYTGSSISYSGGGGGYGSVTGGTAGTNAGDGSTGNGSNATANRGGGGGGGANANTGGNGGSGRVVVRWLTADAAPFSISVTGTTTNGTDGSYTWYAWDSTGTLVVA